MPWAMPQFAKNDLNSAEANWGPLAVQNFTGTPAPATKNERAASIAWLLDVALFWKATT